MPSVAVMDSIPFRSVHLLMFTVPNSTDLIKLIYVFVTYNLSNSIVGTATWLSYNTLLSLLTRDQLERGMISTIRQALCPLIEGIHHRHYHPDLCSFRQYPAHLADRHRYLQHHCSRMRHDLLLPVRPSAYRSRLR